MPQSSRHFFNYDLLMSYVRQAGKALIFRRRDVILSAGDRNDWVFFIEKGSAKVTLTSLQGKEAVIDILHEGDFFGESALDNHRLASPTNTVALTDLQLTRIGREALLRLLHTQPYACDAFISIMAGLIARTRSEIAAHLLYGSEQRLARALLSVAHLRSDEQFRLVTKISQQELASMIGVTRQRVNILLKRFRKLGLIDYAGGLRIHRSIRSAATKD